MDYLLPALGGLLIGVASALLLYFNRRQPAVSGIVSGVFLGEPAEARWKAAFVSGLVAGGFLLFVAEPSLFRVESLRSTETLALAGFLVGIGSRLGRGCVSGHGICGISNLSLRSLLATLTFIVSGAVTVLVLRWLDGSGA